ncbi:hypothetical protein A6X21_05465 [Planctopirus hydrillae]|uniref:Uncharacterized protein n=1 Tax=Planctopirus hydrillae TaxID=1841610 RepID=A0A1C3EBW1_9PLAN|nr:hypothetical protein A6X21_05465 [Planctopirus hydrillae]
MPGEGLSNGYGLIAKTSAGASIDSNWREMKSVLRSNRLWIARQNAFELTLIPAFSRRNVRRRKPLARVGEGLDVCIGFELFGTGSDNTTK